MPVALGQECPFFAQFRFHHDAYKLVRVFKTEQRKIAGPQVPRSILANCFQKSP